MSDELFLGLTAEEKTLCAAKSMPLDVVDSDPTVSDLDARYPTRIAHMVMRGSVYHDGFSNDCHLTAESVHVSTNT